MEAETVRIVKWSVGEDGLGPTVKVQSGEVIFLEAMWGGVQQRFPVDPDEVDELIEALQGAREVSRGG